MSTNIVSSIVVGKYAQKHFIEWFSKTHKHTRNNTWKTIEIMLLHLDSFLMTSKISAIHSCVQGEIFKAEFKIVGSNESPKTSGNRIVLYLEYETQTCTVLLVYNKNHVQGANETAWWLREIKNNYGEIMKEFEAESI